MDVARELARTGAEHLALHARGRALSGREHYDLAVRLSVSPSARPFVNDRLDVALAVRAGGVQLGHGSLTPAEARRLDPAWWIGMSIHDLDEARAAEMAGADYLLVGPVYATATHPDRAPLGVPRFAEIARLGLPAIAIGGITPERAVEVREAGAYGVAAIRALWDAEDPGAAVREFMKSVGSDASND